jgi:hypothetical protein
MSALCALVSIGYSCYYEDFNTTRLAGKYNIGVLVKEKAQSADIFVVKINECVKGA